MNLYVKLTFRTFWLCLVRNYYLKEGETVEPYLLFTSLPLNVSTFDKTDIMIWVTISLNK